MTGTVDLARDRLVQDVKSVVTDTEALLHAASGESKEKVVAMKPRLEAALARVRDRIVETERAVESRAKETAQRADAYAREHPWETAAYAAAAGAALGALLAVLIARR